MFRKVTSELANPEIENFKVSAALGGAFGAAAFIAYARCDGLLTSLLATMATTSIVWATNQYWNSKDKNQVGDLPEPRRMSPRL